MGKPEYFDLKILKDIKNLSSETLQYKVFLRDLLDIASQIERGRISELNDEVVIDIEGMEEELSDMQNILNNMQFKLIMFKKQFK